ncbi:MAG: DUF58 domain-containing protein [Ilumatobacteraceae bacterium]
MTVLPTFWPIAVPGQGPTPARSANISGRSAEPARVQGLRDYVPGDDLRRIAEAPARRGLKVRENRSQGSKQLSVLLDVGAASHAGVLRTGDLS